VAGSKDFAKEKRRHRKRRGEEGVKFGTRKFDREVKVGSSVRDGLTKVRITESTET